MTRPTVKPPRAACKNSRLHTGGMVCSLKPSCHSAPYLWVCLARLVGALARRIHLKLYGLQLQQRLAIIVQHGRVHPAVADHQEVAQPPPQLWGVCRCVYGAGKGLR